MSGYAGAPGELVRSQEPGFAALGLDETALSSPDVAVDVLAGHPELLQCPVLVRSDRVVIGRPTERVAELLD